MTANEQDRSQVHALTEKVQEVIGEAVAIAFVDQDYTGTQAAQNAEAHHVHLEVVKLPEANKGFGLLPKRWVMERSNARAARLRRLARNYAQLAETLADLHFVVFTILMLKRLVEQIV